MQCKSVSLQLILALVSVLRNTSRPVLQCYNHHNLTPAKTCSPQEPDIMLYGFVDENGLSGENSTYIQHFSRKKTSQVCFIVNKQCVQFSSIVSQHVVTLAQVTFILLNMCTR